MTLVAKVTMKKGWDSTKGLERGLAEMATDIDTRAKVLAPKDTRALVNSSRIKRLSAVAYQISFGNRAVPYAYRRHYENYKNPQTLGYLSRAADSVARSDKGKYFKGKVA